MGKQKHNYKGSKEFKGLKGWEIKYLKDSIRYGHLDSNNTGIKPKRRAQYVR